MAYAFTYRAADKTLTEVEVNSAHDKPQDVTGGHFPRVAGRTKPLGWWCAKVELLAQRGVSTAFSGATGSGHPAGGTNFAY